MITKDMSITDIIFDHPEVMHVFQKHGMGCIGCMSARFEDLNQGAQVHGIDADLLVADLNAAMDPDSANA